MAAASVAEGVERGGGRLSYRSVEDVRVHVRDGGVPSRSAVAAECVSVGLRLHRAVLRPPSPVASTDEFRRSRLARPAVHGRGGVLGPRRRPRPVRRDATQRPALGRQGRAVRLRPVLRARRNQFFDARRRPSAGAGGRSVLAAVAAVRRPGPRDDVDRGRLPAAAAAAATPRRSLRLRLDPDRRPILRRDDGQRTNGGPAPGRRPDGCTGRRLCTVDRRVPITRPQPRLQHAPICQRRHRPVAYIVALI